jgi:hypothetical protein
MRWVSSHWELLLQWPSMLCRVLGGVKRRSLSRSPLRNVRLLLGARLDPIHVGYGYLKPHGSAALSGSVGVAVLSPKVSWVEDSRARLCAAGNLVGWAACVRKAVELSR